MSSEPPSPSEDLNLRPAEASEVDEILALANQHLGPGVADGALVHAIWRHNPTVLLALLAGTPPTQRLVGFVAFLPLTAAGHRAMIEGTFTGAQPRIEWIARADETASAIYFWASVAIGRAARIVELFDVGPFGRRYGHLDRFSSASTEAGIKVHLRNGYRPLRHDGPPQVGDFFVRYGTASASVAQPA